MQSVVQSKNPMGLQLQDVEHPFGSLLAVPHPTAPKQEAPCVQPVGVGGPEHMTPH